MTYGWRQQRRKIMTAKVTPADLMVFAEALHRQPDRDILRVLVDAFPRAKPTWQVAILYRMQSLIRERSVAPGYQVSLAEVEVAARAPLYVTLEGDKGGRQAWFQHDEFEALLSEVV